MHLDLVVDDLDAATAEVEQLGGPWLEPGTTRELEGFRWRCMADPEGNEFDLDVLPPVRRSRAVPPSFSVDAKDGRSTVLTRDPSPPDPATKSCKARLSKGRTTVIF